ncbi:MAG TPA: DUF3313 domain-containing protein [Terriglobales bacterium]|jgi:hypothetical protein|nr:DUF3313 domain-containing protein [Terriglobales bacterium]
MQTRHIVTKSHNGEKVALRGPDRHVIGGISLSQFLFRSLIAGSLLLIGLTTQAQDSSKPQESDSKEVSGFLGDYSGLYPDPKNGDLLIYEKSKDTLKNYRRFILDPVTVYLLPGAQDRGIDPDDLDRLARYFTDAITDELVGSGYEVVTEPGPGVLELQIAITNVEPTGGKKNAALKAGTTAASLTVAPGVGLVVPRLSVGKIGIEGEMIDSVSGERMVAFVTGKGGRRWFSGLNAYKKWGDIEAAFRSWAKNFRKRLDELHES